MTSTPFTSYAIQKALKVTVDGKWGPETEVAMRAALGSPRDNTGRPWSRKRLVVGYQQKLMLEAGIQTDVDGLIGPETLHAFEKYQDLMRRPDAEKATIAAGVSWWSWKWLKSLWASPTEPIVENRVVVVPESKPAPSASPRTSWPRQIDVPGYFGPMGQNQTIIQVPWQMQLAWDPSVKTSRMSLHTKVAPSAERALKLIFEHYGPDGIKKLGLDQYGGSLNVRKMRGGDSYSMHSWGIAIDWDPNRNELRWDHTKARLAKADAQAFWDIWESEGWVSLGRERDFDWMHVQAARL